MNQIQEELYSKISLLALDRVLNNIIDNAIKYNRPNGKICITLKSDDKSIFLIIQDTGYGIKPDRLEKIFVPYYQCPVKSINQGIGAGLSLVKKILDEVSAKIIVKSTYKKGTTVEIIFKQRNLI